MLFVILFELFFFALVLYKLVTTNHWSVGKKLLVALIAGIIVESLGFLLALYLSVPILAVSIIKVPKIVVGIIMTYYFYRHESVFEHKE